jgi:SSS family solute:Na+ symporter
MPWGRWPLTIHSAGWGMIFNLGIALIVSVMTQAGDNREHKMTFHNFLREHASLPDSKKSLVPIAWIITLAWFFFGIGPGAVIGNWIFGDPNDAATWIFGMPSIWAWQLLFWALGVGMMWFLAYKMEMSTVPTREVQALHEDIGDVHLDVDRPS